MLSKKKRHPMYKNTGLVNMINTVMKYFNTTGIRNDNLGVLGVTSSDIDSFISLGIIFEKIPKDGYVTMNVDEQEWKSDITYNTFKKLKVNDIKLPFNSGSISAGGKDFFFARQTKEEIINRSRTNKTCELGVDESDVVDMLNISYMDKETNVLVYADLRGDDFILNDKIVDDDVRDMVTIVISTLIYVSAFKTETTRVRSKKILCKKSSSFSTPKHVINHIRLYQTIKDNEYSQSKNGSSWKSEKRWLVRGHWRNQYYKTLDKYKPKWIDPFWKGSGSEEIEKVYHVK